MSGSASTRRHGGTRLTRRVRLVVSIAGVLAVGGCRQSDSVDELSVGQRCVPDSAEIARSDIVNPSNNERFESAERVLVLSDLPRGSAPLDMLGPFATREKLNALVGRTFDFSVSPSSSGGLVAAFDTDRDLRDTACALAELSAMSDTVMSIADVTDD